MLLISKEFPHWYEPLGEDSEGAVESICFGGGVVLFTPKTRMMVAETTKTHGKMIASSVWKSRDSMVSGPLKKPSHP